MGVTVRVSVVITSFDHARHLPAAIDSALAQTHPDTEVVVVDDGSTDGSRDVLAAFGERVVAVLKPNGGQGSAVNAGWRAATGDAVVFLDADDALLPEAAAVTARHLADAAVAKVHWPLEVVDGAGRVLAERWPAGPLPQGDLRGRLRTCADQLSPPQSGNAYPRWVLDELLPMPEAPFVTGADTWLFLLAPALGVVRRHDAPLGRYRRHESNGFSGHPFDARMRRLRGWTDVALGGLEELCARHGVPADPQAWRRTMWVHRVERAVAALDRAVPAGRPFVLVDDGDWGMVPDGRRRPVPFLERDGQWWGPPADDASAVAELERLRAAGVRHLALAWPAFWWLEHFPGWAAHLEGSSAVVAATEDVVVRALEPA